ncbi:MAG: chemotaxis protein CheD [Candidatus Omnitrophica bacterium]|nr:chemotaxis protein CheD [Candidatus Omnitrophota bacterium]
MAVEVSVGMADIKLGRDGDVLATVLGSCIGVCLFSASHGAGGLLHLMMPTAGNNAAQPGIKKAKYADTGVPELVHSLKVSFGVQPKDLVAKIFGGAKVLQNVERNIGAENAVAVQAILKEYGIPLKAHKTGGERGYRIKFHTESGKVICQVFGGPTEEY